MHGRRYPREFKLDAVCQVQTGAKRPSQVLRVHTALPKVSCCAGAVSTRSAARKRFCRDHPRVRKRWKPESLSWSGTAVNSPSNLRSQKKP